MATWTVVEAKIRGRLAETTTTGFWTSAELQQWFNNGVTEMHRAVWQQAREMEKIGFSQAFENEYLNLWLMQSFGVMAPQIQDYDLPSDFWRMARVTIGTSPPVEAVSVQIADDRQIRLGGRLGPTPTVPLYALTPQAAKSQVRFYVQPGVQGAPIHALPYTLHYWREPACVDLSASPPIENEVPHPFDAAPIAWACYSALIKERTDGTAYKQEFMDYVQSFVPGPSRETQ